MIIAASAALAVGGTSVADGATGSAAQARVTDGDADIFGKRIRLEADTTMSTSRVTFIYGGERYRAKLVETDMEDRTREWSHTARSLKSDRSAGRTVKFRVRACDASACTTTRYTEIVEWDD